MRITRAGKISVGWTIALSLLGLLLLGVLIFAFKMAGAGQQVQDELKAIAAKGEPVDVAQLGGTPIPASQNGASDYASAFAILYAPGADVYKRKYGSMIDPAPKPLSESQWKEVDQAVRHFEPVVPIVEQAMSKPACKFPVNWSSGAGALFPHLSRLRELSRYLSARAIVAAHNGDADECAKATRMSFGISDSVRDEPMLISMLVRVAMIRIGTSALRDSMNHVAFNELQAKQIDSTIAKIDLASHFKCAMIGERAMGLWCFDQVRSGGYGTLMFSSGSASAAGNNVVMKTFINQDELYYLRMMRSEIKNASLTCGEVKMKHISLSFNPPRYAVITTIIFPVYERAREARDTATANISCARVCSGLQAYKSRFGSYPATLNELRSKLKWQLPKDPFSVKDLVYKRQNKGFLLYSLGPNMRDDGGRVDPTNTYAPHTGDIVWRILK